MHGECLINRVHKMLQLVGHMIMQLLMSKIIVITMYITLNSTFLII